jgi:GNS1/SUR4 family
MAAAIAQQGVAQVEAVVSAVFKALPAFRHLLPAAYLRWADAVEPQIIQFFVPGLKAVSPARATLPWSSFAEAFALVLVYVAIVLFGFARKSLGGKPVPEILVKPLMVLYNAVQVILCGYMSWRAFDVAVQNNYGFSCNEFNPKNSTLVFVLHVFYLSKVLDFLDTVFMIARSSWRQLSFLHYYHHASIFFMYWLVSSVCTTGAFPRGQRFCNPSVNLPNLLSPFACRLHGPATSGTPSSPTASSISLCTFTTSWVASVLSLGGAASSLRCRWFSSSL